MMYTTVTLSSLFFILTVLAVKSQFIQDEQVDHNYDDLVLSIGAKSRHRPFKCKKAEQFDDLRLAVQWVPGICIKNNPKEKSCKVNSISNRFTIHGLWPSNNHGRDQMNCCSDIKFSMQNITDLRPRLQVSL